MTTKQELENKLKNRFFVIGGGAWQQLWEPDKPSMGFKNDPTESDIEPSSKDLKNSIRPELLKRFRARVLVMQPMSKQDYQLLIPQFAKILPVMLQSRFIELAEEDIDTAVEEQLGMRYFEEVLTQFLTEQINPNTKEKTL